VLSKSDSLLAHTRPGAREQDDPNRAIAEVGRCDPSLDPLIVPPESVVNRITRLERVPVAVPMLDGHHRRMQPRLGAAVGWDAATSSDRRWQWNREPAFVVGLTCDDPSTAEEDSPKRAVSEIG